MHFIFFYLEFLSYPTFKLNKKILTLNLKIRGGIKNMKKMKLKNQVIITIILSCVFLIAGFSVMSVDVAIPNGTKDVCLMDPLWKSVFLFGQVQI